MKMSQEDYNTIVKAFEYNAEKVKSHYEHIKASGNYGVLENRVAWNCLRAFVGSGWICEQYDKGLKDSHITTASVKALKSTLGL